MLVAVRGGLARVLGLFVSDWTVTLGAFVILAVAWLLSRQAPVPPLAFAVAGALGALLILDAVLAGRRASTASRHDRAEVKR